jgi:hypothetical protein
MRRLIPLAALLAALAAPDGMLAGGRITVVAPSPSQSGAALLRGSQSAADDRGVTAVARDSGDVLDPTQALALSPARPPAGPLSASELGQCRLSCAQTYYFCLAQDASEDCSPQWGQCRAACDAPAVSRNLAAGYLGQNP